MHNITRGFCLAILLSLGAANAAQAQIPMGDQPKPVLGGNSSSNEDLETYKQKEYTIANIKAMRPDGSDPHVDQDLLKMVTGLTEGMTVRLPNDDKIQKAIKNLWKQDLFADVQIRIEKIIGDKIFLQIVVTEMPQLSRYNFKGIKKGEATELKDKVGLIRSKVVTPSVVAEAEFRIKKFFQDKGYGNVTVSTRSRLDSNAINYVILTFNINKGYKTHINQISIEGNEHASEAKVKRNMKGTKEMARLSLHPADKDAVYKNDERSFGNYLKHFGFLSLTKTLAAVDPYFRYNFFSSSKFNRNKYEDDKEQIIRYYNSLGYRDASIVSDTVYKVQNGNLNVDIKVSEGHRYYFGDIKWRGNTKYTDQQLAGILNIKKGDVYNQELLDSRIGRQMSPEGGEDISSLYMDDGYLFFNIDPVEVSVVGDTINYEMRVTEGAQATINEITIKGNDRTNEHVIRRELRTYPGNKFSRQDIIRSQRQIAQLNFFDAEKIGILPKPHPENGTVDIEYTVTEKSSDQLQLSAGFGGGVKFYGNIGILFNNFSLRNIFKPKTWDPLPIGDGQKFSVNYQSNGAYYNSFNTSFTEPWLGGKKPNALTASFVYSKYSGVTYGAADPNSSYLRAIGGGISLSKQLKKPDDFFVLTYGLNYQNYKLKAYSLIPDFNDGYSNNLNLKLVLARYSVNQPLYPRSGSNISFTLQLTPPFSLFSGKDYTSETPKEKYKWIEYHKYEFVADWYHAIDKSQKLVLKLSTKMGFLGYYNPSIGFSPFERFQLGGDGLSGYSFLIGKDIISQRGYEVYADNATIYNKYTAELRYPFSLNPSSTIYGLAFVDAANAWSNFKGYNPFKLNRDAGLGVRIYLPMFGLLGLDYGVGFDRYNPDAGVTSFKDISKFTFMLGFEPK